MKVTLIHNPVAGHIEQPDAQALQELIRQAGHSVNYHPSDEIDWTALHSSGCDLVAVAGGDGTAGQIAKRLVDRGIPMTFIPMGTANNISKTFGLSEYGLEQLIGEWSSARSHWIDVGVIDAPWGSHYFIEGVGMGLFVRTMMEIDSRQLLGHLETPEEKIVQALRILSQRLLSFPARQLNLTLDGKDLSGEYLLLEVMNIRFVGPNMYIAPTSDPTDGMLDVVLVTERERNELHKYLASWRQGVMSAPAFATHQGSHLQLDWDGSALHVDDLAWPPEELKHPVGPARIDIRAKRRALEVRVPVTSRLHR